MMDVQQQQQSSQQPLHSDNHRVPMNLTMIFAMGIAVIGMFSGAALLFFAGMGVAAYTWFTRPRRYLIYANSLVIDYGRPRIKVVSLSEISHVELLSLPIGDRLRVVLLNGRRTMILAKDLDTFQEKLDQALESYQSGNPGGRRREDPPDAGSGGDPRIIDVTPELPQTQALDGPGTTLDPDKKPDFEGPSPS